MSKYTQALSQRKRVRGGPSIQTPGPARIENYAEAAKLRGKLRALSFVQQRTPGGAESASCFPRTHLTGSAVDSRRHLAREGSLPAWAETFLKGSGSSMELEPGPEDALIVVLRCSRNEIVNL